MRINVYLPDELAKRVESHCAKTGEKRSSFIARLVSAELGVEPDPGSDDLGDGFIGSWQDLGAKYAIGLRVMHEGEIRRHAVRMPDNSDKSIAAAKARLGEWKASLLAR